jgi:3-oxoacyl-[acyl-carrier protein] reductase
VDRAVALVTGSSRGLGAAIARRLAADGLAIAVNDFSGGAAGRAVAESIRDGGGVAEVFTADVTDESAVRELVAAIEGALGPVGVLVVCATGPQPDAPALEVGWDAHVAQLDFFVKSPVLLLRAVLPGMRERRFGRIVQIDSEIFDSPPPGRSAYAAAKGAQIGLARAWARELAPDGVTVNCVAECGLPHPAPVDITHAIRGLARCYGGAGAATLHA